MKTSAIIATKDYGKYLPKALESLLQQSCEIIVVNDGSTDNTAEILKDYPVKVITTDGVGLATACNLGISEASGEYIIRVDADDWVAPDLIEQEQRVMEETGCDAVWCDYIRVDGDYHEYVRNNVLKHAGGVLFRKSCWEALGGYNETLEYQESFDFWIRFKKLFHVEHLAKPMYFYRKHDESMSTNVEAREAARKMILAWHC